MFNEHHTGKTLFKASEACNFESFSTKPKFLVHLGSGMVMEAAGALLVTGRDAKSPMR